MRVSVFVFAAALAASLPAQVGSALPRLEVEKSFNFDAFKLENFEQLKGSAIFIEYWRTW